MLGSVVLGNTVAMRSVKCEREGDVVAMQGFKRKWRWREREREKGCCHAEIHKGPPAQQSEGRESERVGREARRFRGARLQGNSERTSTIALISLQT